MDTLWITEDYTIRRHAHLRILDNPTPIEVSSPQATLTNRGFLDLQITEAAESTGVFSNGSFINVGQLNVIGTSSFGVEEMRGAGAGEFIFRNEGRLHVWGETAIGALVQGADFDNRGSIDADGAVAMGAELIDIGGSNYRNSGSIEANQSDHRGTGVWLDPENSSADGLSRFDNSGTIRAGTAMFVGGNYRLAQVEVTNSGVLLGEFSSTVKTSVVNTGSISGQVFFGATDDFYDGRRGHLELSNGSPGYVWGGGGTDTLLGGREADWLIGDAHGAFSSGLLSGGGGNDTLIGGNADGTLIGGAGCDQLVGGAGADTFIFRSLKDLSPDRPDEIYGLDSTDRIQLSHIDADLERSGNQDFRLVLAFDEHGGEAVKSYDAVTQTTRLELDVNGDAVADAALLLNGDQTAFTNFVL